MALTFRSTIQEVFKIIGQDTDGSRRVAEATKVPGQTSRWDLKIDASERAQLDWLLSRPERARCFG
jgi:hypothetical protein